MGRKASKSTAVVIQGVLYTEDEWTGTRIDDSRWAEWLALGRSFYVQSSRPGAGFTVRSQSRRKGTFWYAVKKIDGKVRSVYLGKLPTGDDLRQLELSLT